MALLSFSYLVTAYAFTVFTHAPFVIAFCGFAFQAIAFLAGIDVTDLNDYVFWDWLTITIGCFLGVAHNFVTRFPQPLRFYASYLGVWGIFVLWGLFFLAAQLFYNFFPPPQFPWGIIGTGVSFAIIQILLWVILGQNQVVFSGYMGKRYHFLLWLVILVVITVMEFLAYVILERWASYAGAGLSLVILIIAYFAFPLKQAFLEGGTPISGEPLIMPPADLKNNMQPGDANGFY